MISVPSLLLYICIVIDVGLFSVIVARNFFVFPLRNPFSGIRADLYVDIVVQLDSC